MKGKKIIAMMMALTLTFGVVAFGGCKENKNSNQGDASIFEEFPDAETPGENVGDEGAIETPGENVGDEGAIETPVEGGSDESETTEDGIVVSNKTQYLKANKTYGLSRSVAFLSTDVTTTSTSVYTPVTATLKATVNPVDADQRVDWTYEFVNAESEWATGKTLADYLTIAPQADGSTSLDVTCLQPFGEQIKITCTSLVNNNISASAVVDFLATATLKSVSFGTGETAIPINFGGETIVKWDISGETDYGGNLTYETETDCEVYTKIDENIIVRMNGWINAKSCYGNYQSTSSPNYNDGYLLADISSKSSFSSLNDDLGVDMDGFNSKYFYTSQLFDIIYVQYTSLVFADEYRINQRFSDDEIAQIMGTLTENTLCGIEIFTKINGVQEYRTSIFKLEIV